MLPRLVFRLLLCVLLVGQSAMAASTASDPPGRTTYPVTLTAPTAPSLDWREASVPATLCVTPSKDNVCSTVTLELSVPTTVSVLRLLAAELPPQFQGVLGSDPERVYLLGESPDRRELSLCLVGADTSATLFAGQVVGEDGRSVEGALIGLNWRQLSLDGDGPHPDYDAPRLPTGRDGRFAFAIPASILREKTRKNATAPDGPLLAAEVSPPKWAKYTSNGLVPTKLHPGGDNKVVMPRLEELNVQLLDEQGKVVRDESKLRLVTLNLVEGEGNTASLKWLTVPRIQDQDLTSGVLHFGCVPVPGGYRLYLTHPENKPYQFRRLEPGMTQGVIQWHPDTTQRVVTGRIVDARTGAPIAGAFLGGGDQQQRRMAMAMDPGERQRIWAQWDKGLWKKAPREHHGPDDEPVFDLYAAAQSAKDGTYRLKYAPAMQTADFFVYAPGYIGTDIRLSHYKTNHPELTSFSVTEMAFPDIPLLAGARVKTKLLPPTPPPDMTLYHNEPNPDKSDWPEDFYFSPEVAFGVPKEWGWKPAEVDECGFDDTWEYVRPDWGEDRREYDEDFDTKFDVNVPAGVKFNLSITAHHFALRAAEWEGIGPLAPNSLVELPAKTLPEAKPYAVLLSYPDGTPARDLWVHLAGCPDQKSDERGVALGWTSEDEIYGLYVWRDKEHRDTLISLMELSLPENEEFPVLPFVVPQE